MKHIVFDPNTLSGEQKAWWQAWRKRALNATSKVMAQAQAGEPITLNPAIWSDLKRWLLAHVFAGKCAYCESNITVTDYGAADHYRPKKRVIPKLADGGSSLPWTPADARLSL